jgi:hypothetical protein
MISFHFPPVQGSSGVQRTLKFARYLPEHGWQPLILSAHPRAYQRLSQAQLGEIRDDVMVRRTFAFDSARHLAWRGRYPSALALPDRWASWWLSAVPAGLEMIRRHRPAAIWSTYPIATAHMIGLTLQRLSGLPWIADFRDPMTEDDYPVRPTVRRVYRWIETHTVRRCARAVFTTPGAQRMYAERYPELPAARWARIENGYDEENFQQAADIAPPPRPARVTLLHSGLLYPVERDPRAFFGALVDLRAAGDIDAGRFAVVLRATGHDGEFARLIAEHGLGDLVRLEPPVAYHAALAEMLAADALLIFQAANCNHQIPAKLYEYLRARRPIFALTDAAGDTAAVLRAAGIDTVVPLDRRAAIAAGLRDFLARLRAGRAPVADAAEVERHSRRARSAELAALLDEVIA